MKYTYRSINYTKNSPAIEAVETPFLGTFLGNAYPVRRYNTSPVERATSELKYRGCSYTKLGLR